MHWFTSDLHFLDNDLKRHHKPFRSPNEYYYTLIENINERVGDEDILWVIGDVFLTDYYDKARELLSKIKCKNKILIRGNHDTDERMPVLDLYFRKILDKWDGDIDGTDIYMNHIPSKCPKSKFSLTGHVHDAWKIRKNLINVGVDVHHYYPISLDDVRWYKDRMDGGVFDEETYIS